jgi:hypothetical protein
MWYAGCTYYRAVYVFDLDNPISQHGKDFWLADRECSRDHLPKELGA